MKTNEIEEQKECEHFWMPAKWSQGLGEIWVEEYYCAKCLIKFNDIEGNEELV